MRKSDQFFVVNLNQAMENSLPYVELFMEQIKFNLAFWLILLLKKRFKGWYVIIVFLKMVKTLFEHVVHVSR